MSSSFYFCSLWLSLSKWFFKQTFQMQTRNHSHKWFYSSFQLFQFIKFIRVRKDQRRAKGNGLHFDPVEWADRNFLSKAKYFFHNWFLRSSNSYHKLLIFARKMKNMRFGNKGIKIEEYKRKWFFFHPSPLSPLPLSIFFYRQSIEVHNRRIYNRQ